MRFAVLGLALVSYALAIEAGGNGFVGAFIGGLAFGSITPAADDHIVGFTDDAGELLSLLVWFLFGAAMIVPAFEHLVWQDVVFALLALTVVRMVPVGIALAGAGLDRATVAFIGWFGPRGLASVVFVLIAFDSLDPTDGEPRARRRHSHGRAQRDRTRHHRRASRRPIRTPRRHPACRPAGTRRCSRAPARVRSRATARASAQPARTQHDLQHDEPPPDNDAVVATSLICRRSRRVSGVEAIEQVVESLHRDDITLIVARMKSPIEQEFSTTHLTEAIGEEKTASPTCTPTATATPSSDSVRHRHRTRTSSGYARSPARAGSPSSAATAHSNHGSTRHTDLGRGGIEHMFVSEGGLAP